MLLCMVVLVSCNKPLTRTDMALYLLLDRRLRSCALYKAFFRHVTVRVGTGQNPPPAKKKKKKTFGQIPPPPAKIPLRPKPPSDKKPPPAKNPHLLSLINNYHPKLRLFYIKFRLGGQWHFVLTITITCKFFVIPRCNLSRSPGGGFWPEVFFLLKGGFSRRGVLSGVEM